MSVPLVVIIPTKNRRALRERALKSVLSQSYESYRIVVINDGSTDDTREYLESFKDSHMQVIHNEKSRGVNAARNAALRTLKEGEWGVQLDDDDTFMTGALSTIAKVISEIPLNIQLIAFNSLIRTPEEEYVGGRDFLPGEKFFEPSYLAIMTDNGLRLHGDNRPIWKWSLFPKYLFSEDVNGFEGEWWLLVARDEIGIRFVPEQTTVIDLVHMGEHLSNVASRRDPGSFVRAQERIFRDHTEFFRTHPKHARDRAIVGFKLAVRAFNPFAGLRFLYRYFRTFFLG
jgi:glycosyltransferase involved in cell wall biosynthesis